MQFLKALDKHRIVKVAIILLSIPLIVKVLYYINIVGVYFGSFLRRFVSFFWC